MLTSQILGTVPGTQHPQFQTINSAKGGLISKDYLESVMDPVVSRARLFSTALSWTLLRVQGRSRTAL